MTAAARTRRFAPAKLNLYLHVGDKRADGYHELASLVIFADVGDALEVRPAKQLSLSLQGPFAEALTNEPNNLVLRAARELDVWAEERGHRIAPVEIVLTKNLPIASGIGGGSSDAAAALLILASHWSLPIPFEELEAIGKGLGADVPVCLRARPTLVQGMGERLTPVADVPPFALVLVNPKVEVPTRRVFETLHVRSGAVAPTLPPLTSARDFAMLLDRTTNDLAAPAKAIAPAILRVESALVGTEGSLIARMSGSGATCFGLYETAAAAEAAARAIAARHPEWWVAAAASYVAA